MKSPVEWPVNAGGKEKPIDNTTAVASSNQVDVVCIGGWVLRGYPGDQLQDEADVVGLIETCRYLSKMYHPLS